MPNPGEPQCPSLILSRTDSAVYRNSDGQPNSQELNMEITNAADKKIRDWSGTSNE